jgi:hypothetical protein
MACKEFDEDGQDAGINLGMTKRLPAGPLPNGGWRDSRNGECSRDRYTGIAQTICATCRTFASCSAENSKTDFRLAINSLKAKS